jgi:hypothetical protein
MLDFKLSIVTSFSLRDVVRIIEQCLERYVILSMNVDSVNGDSQHISLHMGRVVSDIMEGPIEGRDSDVPGLIHEMDHETAQNRYILVVNEDFQICCLQLVVIW